MTTGKLHSDDANAQHRQGMCYKITAKILDHDEGRGPRREESFQLKALIAATKVIYNSNQSGSTTAILRQNHGNDSAA
eukprot:6212046-Pleurochrysis_carterae.AAC.1